MSDNLLTTELSTASVLADSSLNDPNGEWVEPSGWTLRRSSESTETSTLLEEPLQEREAAWVMDAGFWTTTQAIKAPSANILWRNVSTGENRVLQIEGSQQIGTQVLPTRDLNWQIVGTSDFNRDSKDDLLWRNFKTGEVQIWALNGSNVETSVLYTINDLNWQIRGIGDFNRDGSSDIVWRNVSTGTNVVWFLKGTQFSDHLSFNPVSDTNWNITAVSDLNGDGHSDLIWNNAATGETYTWLMNGINYTIANSTQLQNELGWKIVAVQDFTGDQRPDILWHNERTGAVECWENNQATFQRRVTLQNQAPSHSQLVSTADLDADGIPDLLWQDPATGVLTRWLMNRNSVRDSATLSGFFDARWTAVAALQDTGTSSTLQSSLLSNRRIAASTATEGLQSAQMVGSSFNSSGQVNSGKLSDYYRFDTSSSGVFTATLSGLSADADVRLVQDKNSNGAIDTGEILAWQWERGGTNESIRRFLDAGTYYVQVVSYNNQSTGYNVSTTFTAAASDPNPFRINLIFADTVSGLNETAKTAIREAARYWESLITGSSGITRTNTLNITIAGQAFTNGSGGADTSTLALSGPSVGVNGSNLVITRGTSTLNSRRIADFNSNPEYLKSIMTHELLHVLGFGTIWEPVQFQDANGSVFTVGRNFVDTGTSTYTANSRVGYAYGELLGTYTPTAVPIEPQIYAHWDETRFDTELMTPFTEAQGVTTPISTLTLAALQDLGWNVNYGAAQSYSLPTTSQAALRTAGSAPQTTTAASRSARSLTAKYTCGCSRCLSSTGNPLTVTLEDAISA